MLNFLYIEHAFSTEVEESRLLYTIIGPTKWHVTIEANHPTTLLNSSKLFTLRIVEYLLLLDKGIHTRKCSHPFTYTSNAISVIATAKGLNFR